MAKQPPSGKIPVPPPRQYKLKKLPPLKVRAPEKATVKPKKKTRGS